MWRRVDIVLTDVSEERIAPIFRAVKKENPRLLARGFSSFLSPTLKMEAMRSSETSVNTISTWCHIPEDCFLHSHRCENLKSYTLIVFEGSLNMNQICHRSKRNGHIRKVYLVILRVHLFYTLLTS